MRRSIIKVLYTIITLGLLWLLPFAQASAEQAHFAEQKQEQQTGAPEVLTAISDSLVQNGIRQNSQMQDSLSLEHLAQVGQHEPSGTEAPIRYNPRQISEEALAQLRADSDMDYHLASPEDNLWLKFRKWLFIKLLALFGTPAAVNALEIIIYVLIFVALAYTILRLMNVDVQGLFLIKNRRRTVLQQETEAYENIHEVDFMAAIEEALQAQEYNKAVRLLYLSALKELTDGEQIHWQAGKTNYQYQQELAHPGLQMPFRELGYFFEWAWYGNFRLNEKQYQEARTIYQSLKQQLQQKA
jgi:hypothetical protein